MSMREAAGLMLFGVVLIVGGALGISEADLDGEALLYALLIPAVGVVSLGVGLYLILRGRD